MERNKAVRFRILGLEDGRRRYDSGAVDSSGAVEQLPGVGWIGNQAEVGS